MNDKNEYDRLLENATECVIARDFYNFQLEETLKKMAKALVEKDINSDSIPAEKTD